LVAPLIGALAGKSQQWIPLKELVALLHHEFDLSGVLLVLHRREVRQVALMLCQQHLHVLLLPEKNVRHRQ
jgi:hypothetical protein